ncbi:MAG: glycosyltransferase family 2 protein [Acidobacteria bacterium]|nr:glycosyltransferase family 2 protein [Acidobacteriota bacterium]
MNQPQVSVIILNFNGSRWLQPCLQSLRATEYANFKTVLVDNASTDNSVEVVRSQFPEVEVIINPGNLGFSEGNNVAIRKALAEVANYVVLLNPDTRVTPGWLSELIAVGERETGIGILGAIQLTYDSNEFNTWTTTALSAHLVELQSPTARDWIEVEWVEGACFAIKREVIERIGLLDPIYFAFYEEIDFCRRAAFHGYKTAIVPRSRIHHFRGGSWEADAAIKRERDYRCDRSQFIYNLTDPRRSLAANVGWYLQTLATKTKDAAKALSPTKAWDLARIQIGLFGHLPQLFRKWRSDRKQDLADFAPDDTFPLRQ